MGNKFFAELSRRLNIDGIESSAIDEKRLEVFLHGQPVLFVLPANDVFLLPVGSKNEEASELYHQVAVAADEVYGYVDAMQNAPLLHASGLHEDFRLLADFGGAVLAGQERENGQGYSDSCSCYKQDGESEAAHPCKPKQALEWPALWFYNSFGATPYH